MDGDGERQRHGAAETGAWRRRATWLVVATLVASSAELGVGLWAGIAASSIALIAFSLDSGIEMAAGAMVLRRLRLAEEPGAEAAAERRTERFVGVTLLLLATWVVGDAVVRLLGRAGARESVAGIAVAGASLVAMPLLAWGKLRAAAALDSGALRAEAKETLACAWLSGTALVGLLATALAGWWWADAAAALLMVPWLVREGLEALEGEAGEEGE